MSPIDDRKRYSFSRSGQRKGVCSVPDVFTPEERSRIMGRIRAKDTAPEMVVRRIAHALGYRYRLHRSDLPGKPDLVFPMYRSVIFVNGCFWHGHSCRRGALPASNAEFWSKKIGATQARDERSRAELEREGWRVMTLWQCELHERAEVAARIDAFLRAAEEESRT